MVADPSGTRIAYVVAGAAALGVAACAGILGIQDRSIDNDLDGSTTEGGQVDTGADARPSGDGGAIEAGGDGGGMQGDAAQPEGGSCASPCVLASKLNHPFSLVSDTNSVYWTEYGDTLGSANGSVKSCPVSGCGSGPLVYAGGLTNPRGLVVDAQNVYFGTATYSGVNGAIYSCPLAGCGGAPTKLSDADIPFGLAVDATYVYWVDTDDNTIHRVPKGGGTDFVMYDAGDGMLSEPQFCVIDSTSLFLTDSFGDVYREPLGGGGVVFMAPGSDQGGWPVVVDANSVYYGISGSVRVIPKTAVNTDGGPAIATNIPDPTGLVFDPGTPHLYWSDWGSGTGDDGTVGKVFSDGGGQSVLVSSLVTPEAIAISGSYVFWLSNGTVDKQGDVNASTGQLLRTSK